jgi:hypothetical protein
VDSYEVLSNPDKSLLHFDLFDIQIPIIFVTRKAKVAAASRCLFFLHYATMASLDRSRIGA